MFRTTHHSEQLRLRVCLDTRQTQATCDRVDFSPNDPQRTFLCCAETLLFKVVLGFFLIFWK